MKRMKVIDLLSEEVAVGTHEPGHKLNRVGVYQDPLTQSWAGPMCRLAAQMTAFRGKLAQPRKKIYIVEDHPTFREWLTQILNDAGDLMVCGAAGALDQALPAIVRTKPDLVLADIDLPGKSVLKLIKELRSACRSVKLLVISLHTEALHAARVLRLGGDGYIMRQEEPDEIVYAVHDVLEDRIYVSEGVMENPRGGERSRSFRGKNSSAGPRAGCRA